jgi:hypothetical protein
MFKINATLVVADGNSFFQRSAVGVTHTNIIDALMRFAVKGIDARIFNDATGALVAHTTGGGVTFVV